MNYAQREVLERTEDTMTDYGHKMGHVNNEIARQHQIVDSIEEAINELVDRLTAVLRDEDIPDNTNKEPHQVIVPLAEQIHNYNDRLNWSHKRLINILDRLEL